MKGLHVLLLCGLAVLALGAAATISRAEFDRLQMDIRTLKANQELLRARIVRLEGGPTGMKPKSAEHTGKRWTLEQIAAALKKTRSGK